MLSLDANLYKEAGGLQSWVTKFSNYTTFPKKMYEVL